MTKAQDVYERVNALVEQGVKKADAFRQLAEELGQPVKSLQGAYYQYSRKTNGGTSRPSRRETTAADAVEQAISVLDKALASIDGEIEAAKLRADEAQAEYQALKGSAADRRKAIEAKIATLKG